METADTAVPPSQAAVAGALTEDKTVAILSYVTIVGFVVAIVLQQNHKTRLGAFHLRQMLGLVLSGLVGGLCGVVPILGWIVWFVALAGFFVLWFLGLLSAIRGEMRPVPVLGEHYQRWFVGVFD